MRLANARLVFIILGITFIVNISKFYCQFVTFRHVAKQKRLTCARVVYVFRFLSRVNDRNQYNNTFFGSGSQSKLSRTSTIADFAALLLLRRDGKVFVWQIKREERQVRQH